jgi:hypothetical protein
MKCALAMKTYGALKEIACSKRFKERKIQSGSIASNPIHSTFISYLVFQPAAQMKFQLKRSLHSNDKVKSFPEKG